jgi:ribosomal protein S18 acetylase RimI-like enzyme
VVKGLIEEAARAGQALTLGVEKTNPALRLYERLGFRTTHEDDRKFYISTTGECRISDDQNKVPNNLLVNEPRP